MSSKPYQTDGRFDACRCNSAVRSGIAGIACHGSGRSSFKWFITVKTSNSTATVQPHPCTFISTPPAHPLASVSTVKVSKGSPIPVMPTIESKSIESKSDEEIPTTPLKTKASNVSALVSKSLCITTTLISPSASTTPSTSSTASFLAVVVPELAIPAEAYPEHLNRLGSGKDYLCCLCHFTHSNLESILTHVRKHLDITIGCPICSRGYQNIASFCKHDRDVHNNQIVASSASLQDVIVPKEEM